MRGAVRGILLYSRTEQPEIVARCTREFEEYASAVTAIGARIDGIGANEEERRGTAQLRSAVEAWRPIVHEISELCARRDFAGSRR